MKNLEAVRRRSTSRSDRELFCVKASRIVLSSIRAFFQRFSPVFQAHFLHCLGALAGCLRALAKDSRSKLTTASSASASGQELWDSLPLTSVELLLDNLTANTPAKIGSKGRSLVHQQCVARVFLLLTSFFGPSDRSSQSPQVLASVFRKICRR